MAAPRITRRTSPPRGGHAARIEQRLTETTIDGSGEKRRWLREGDIVSVQHLTGKYRIKWVDSDGTVTAFGRVDREDAMQSMRSFPSSAVKTVHHSLTERAKKKGSS